MPWRECHTMDERLRFVARLLDGEKMARLCREFDISRKTGYKIFTRYKDCGVEGLTDRSRRPYRHARQLPFQIERECQEFCVMPAG
jgi:transposase